MPAPGLRKQKEAGPLPFFFPSAGAPHFMLEPPLNPGSGPSLMDFRVGVEPAVMVQMG